MNRTSYEQFAAHAKKQDRIVVYQELIADCLTPIHAFLLLRENRKHTVLIENFHSDHCSYLFLDPFAEFLVKDGEIKLSQQGDIRAKADDPILLLRKMIKDNSSFFSHPHSRYCGSPVGFFSYDAIRFFEYVPDSHQKDENFPEILFQCFEIVICFDHQNKKIVISCLSEVSDDPLSAYQRSMKKIEMLIENLFCVTQLKPLSLPEKIKVVPDIDDFSYQNLVEKAKSYIAEGDIFQVVISRKFQTDFSGDPFDVYRLLRLHSQSPYMFYLSYDDYVIAGASPERLVCFENHIAKTLPIAGTAAINDSVSLDDVVDRLIKSEKDTAEHMMLVDLARNDLGKIAEPGSVRVTQFKKPQLFSHIVHLVSEVEATAKNNFDCLDAFKAVFPAGTLTGAPKMRAMEIIDELETSRRGIYGGAICLIDQLGNLDSFIAIRTALIQSGIITVRAGSGVVYDSNPQSESDETRHKANTVLNAIGQ